MNYPQDWEETLRACGETPRGERRQGKRSPSDLSTILVLATDPTVGNLRLDREISGIRQSLERVRHRLRFRLEPRLAARIEDMRWALLELEPSIVHFCGHGDVKQGLLFDGPDGAPHRAAPQAVEELFQIFAVHVRCVILNACHTAPLAGSLVRHVDHAVGIEGALDDEMAIIYASAFYDALGMGEAVAYAHRVACNAISLSNLEGTERPEYHHRDGAPAHVFKATHRSVVEFDRRSGAGVPWTVPLPRNPFFSGRSQLLTTIRERFAGSPEGWASQCICGLGGIGKTQAVAEYCHRYRDAYPCGVVWVDATSKESLLDDYLELARYLGIEPEALDGDFTRALVLDWLNGRAGWLLVFDNVTKAADLEPFFPTASDGGHVLITTRRTRLSGLNLPRPLELKAFDNDEAVAFLLIRAGVRGESESAAAAQLADAMGGLPLALEQAAAFADSNATSLAAYLDCWKRQPHTLLARDSPLAGGYESTVATTWALNFEQIESVSPAAADVLKIASFLAPEAIPYELFAAGAKHLGPNLRAAAEALANDFGVADLLNPLVRFSLIRRRAHANSFDVHRLVQAEIRRGLDGAEESLWIERTVAGLDAVFPEVAFDAWPICRRLAPHAGQLAQEIEKTQLASPAADRLLNQLASFAHQQGRYTEMLSPLIQAVGIARQLYGDANEETLTSLGNLAVAYRALGQPAEARRLHEEIVTHRVRTLGSMAPETLISMNNWAEALWDCGDLVASQELHSRVLATRRRALGNEHLETALSMYNLASTLLETGDLETAQTLGQEALQIHQLQLREDHPATLNSRGLLAEIRRLQGDLPAARAEQEKLLRRREGLFGKEHPSTLSSMNSLSATLRALGELAAARDLRSKVLAIRTRNLGTSHPATANSKIRLAESARDLEDRAAAEVLFNEAVSALEEVLGKDHPQTREALQRWRAD